MNCSVCSTDWFRSVFLLCVQFSVQCRLLQVSVFTVCAVQCAVQAGSGQCIHCVCSSVCSTGWFTSVYSDCVCRHIHVFVPQWLLLIWVCAIAGTGEVGQVYMDQNGQYFIQQAPEEQQLTASGRPKVQTDCSVLMEWPAWPFCNLISSRQLARLSILHWISWNEPLSTTSPPLSHRSSSFNNPLYSPSIHSMWWSHIICTLVSVSEFLNSKRIRIQWL